jgi:hypothetical protein
MGQPNDIDLRGMQRILSESEPMNKIEARAKAMGL